MFGWNSEDTRASGADRTEPEIDELTLLARTEQAHQRTVVGPGTLLTGDLDAKGDLIVLGAVDGQIKCEGTVHIGEGGNVHGEVLAMAIEVAGKLDGAVESASMVVLPDGFVSGAVATDSLVIRDGGAFEGDSRRRRPDNVTQLSRSSRRDGA